MHQQSPATYSICIVRECKSYRVGSIRPLPKVLHLMDELIRKLFTDDWKPKDIGAGLGHHHTFLKALGVVGMQVPVLPVQLIVDQLPELIVLVAGVKVFSVDEMTPVNVVADIEEDVSFSEVVAEGHVRIKHLVDKGGAGILIVDHGALDQVGRGDEGHIPDAAPFILNNVHIVSGPCIVACI